MVQLTIRKIGNSLGVIFPAEVTNGMKVTEGDKIFLTEDPDGYRITAYDPGFEETMKLAEDFMKRHKNALRKLAE